MNWHDHVYHFKRGLLERTLTAHHGCRSDAAKALGLQRTYFQRLLRSFDVPREHLTVGRPVNVERAPDPKIVTPVDGPASPSTRRSENYDAR